MRAYEDSVFVFLLEKQNANAMCKYLSAVQETQR